MITRSPNNQQILYYTVIASLKYYLLSAAGWEITGFGVTERNGGSLATKAKVCFDPWRKCQYIPSRQLFFPYRGKRVDMMWAYLSFGEQATAGNDICCYAVLYFLNACSPIFMHLFIYTHIYSAYGAYTYTVHMWSSTPPKCRHEGKWEPTKAFESVLILGISILVVESLKEMLLKWRTAKAAIFADASKELYRLSA